jgi:hypothetical protein
MTQLPKISDPFAVPKTVTHNPKPRKPEQVASSVVVRSINVPILESTFDGYFSNRVDVTLTADQTKALKAIMFGLQSKYTKLANGKEVANGSDVFRWILENV